MRVGENKVYRKPGVVSAVALLQLARILFNSVFSNVYDCAYVIQTTNDVIIITKQILGSILTTRTLCSGVGTKQYRYIMFKQKFYFIKNRPSLNCSLTISITFLTLRVLFIMLYIYKTNPCVYTRLYYTHINCTQSKI